MRSLIRFMMMMVSVLLSIGMTLGPAVAQSTHTDDSELVFALVLSRHGIRPPTSAVSHYTQYASDPWPTWDVDPGYLTMHGHKQMELMGAYYRDYFSGQNLLGKQDDKNPPIYVYADNSERTFQTGVALAQGLAKLPPTSVHSAPEGTKDPIFYPAGRTGKPDYALALAALNGRMGNDAQETINRYNPEFDLLEAALGKKNAVRSKSVTTSLGHGSKVVGLEGSIATASTLAEILILEYANGMNAGWGRLTKDQIGQIDRLHTLDFDLKDRTFPIAQVLGSNPLEHILDTLMLHGPAVIGAHPDHLFGSKDDKLVVVVGHDDQISAVGGLLRADWQLKDFALDDPTPGGAMVFELRRQAGGDPNSADSYVVRVYFVSQTLDQMRNLTPLTPVATGSAPTAQTPCIAPMFIPGASSSSDHYDCPLTKFRDVVEGAIDRRFTSK